MTTSPPFAPAENGAVAVLRSLAAEADVVADAVAEGDVDAMVRGLPLLAALADLAATRTAQAAADAGAPVAALAQPRGAA